ncbi:hypothetical protein LYSHEL_22180 [Lysobacter helvus]|uniref:Uncharacterized protein n=2 Tax=Lysobacteraceae TaxID=32033 RepID=A0ABN6FW64_9GAMM|nr:hypothetical protein LYSCAS_22190 [Lysobacter caseinilyticus]BCT96347.1 hypothetical protein LYSHEL_22180 [Lysobacter helvus]
MRKAFDKGQHGVTTMSWKPGEARWTSLGARWERKARPTRHPWGWAAGAGAGVVAFMAIGVGVPSAVFADALPTPLRSMGAQIALIVVAGVLAVALLAVAMRRAAERGGMRLPLAVGVLLFVATSLMSAGLMRQRAKVDRARHENENASMVLNAAGDVVQIKGYIAGDFARDFNALLARAPHLATIEIDSPGGLVDDALKVAAVIQSRDLRVRVDRECASACVLLWAASPTREMGISGAIGLHQARGSGDMPKEWQDAGLALTEAPSQAILKGAGFSEALLAKRSTTSPDSMEWIGAVELVDEGVALRVVNDAGATPGRAELVMADMLRRDGAEGDARRLYLAYAVASPGPALRHAQALRAAQREGRSLAPASDAMNTEARAFAMSHAPDDALLRWATQMLGLYGEGIDGRNPNVCVALVDAAQGTPDPDTKRRRLEALADLMAAIPANAPRASFDANMARDADIAIRTEFSARMRQGHPESWRDWTTPQQCAFVQRLYSMALAQPPDKAATAIRVIEGVQ